MLTNVGRPGRGHHDRPGPPGSPGRSRAWTAAGRTWPCPWRRGDPHATPARECPPVDPVRRPANPGGHGSTCESPCHGLPGSPGLVWVLPAGTLSPPAAGDPGLPAGSWPGRFARPYNPLRPGCRPARASLPSRMSNGDAYSRWARVGRLIGRLIGNVAASVALVILAWLACLPAPWSGCKT